MNERARQFGEYLLRGYGQLFVTNNLVSGALYAVALFLASPRTALLSLFAAALATGLALWRVGPTSTVRSGLFGVNGVLLGGLWAFVPEVPWSTCAAVTAVGTVIMTAFLHSGVLWLKHRNLGLTLFSLPYVLVAWCCLAILSQQGTVEPQLTHGWEALRSSALDRAEQAFLAAQPTTDRGLAYQADGLGWTSFRQGDFIASREHFEQALIHWPNLADAADGLGWSQYRLGEYEAAALSFRQAVATDRWLADSWNGLGWLAVGIDDTDEAERCFACAAWVAPFCADAYAGWKYTAAITTQEYPEHVARRLQTWTTTYIPRRFQWTTLPQCGAWLLFAVGIVWHSRWSAGVAFGGVAVSLLIAQLCSVESRQTFDALWLMNIVAINIALGGHYFKPGLGSAAWAWLVSGLVTLAWGFCHAWAATYGLPLLCALFNVALLGSLALAGCLPRFGMANLTIPLDVAVTSPAQVWLWTRQRDIAARCWRVIAANR